MPTEPDDPKDRTRSDLARLREAINGRTHWVFATDDPFAAHTLRKSAAGALFVAIVMRFTDRRDVFPFAVLVVSKKAWPPSAALRVASAAGGQGAEPSREADLFVISRDTARLAVVLQQIRDGNLSTVTPRALT